MSSIISYHIGAHGNVTNHLSKIFNKNRKLLRDMGVVIPFPAKYRKIEGDIYSSNLNFPISLEEQLSFFKLVSDIETFERFVVSHNAFISNRWRAITEVGLYPSLQKKMDFLDNLFFDLDVEIYLEIESLATFPFTVYNELHNDKKRLLNSPKFSTFRWAELVNIISTSLPNAKIIVFCTEDLPFVWPTIVQKMTGITSVFTLKGIFDLPLGWIEPAEQNDFIKKIQSSSTPSIEQYSFLIEKYCPPIKDLSAEYESLGWNQQHYTFYNSLYQKDIENIENIPNVEVL